MHTCLHKGVYSTDKLYTFAYNTYDLIVCDSKNEIINFMKSQILNGKYKIFTLVNLFGWFIYLVDTFI